MARHSELALRDLSTEDLADIQEAAEDFVCQVVKVDFRRLVISIERRMGNAITRAWSSVADRALGEGLRKLIAGPFTNSRIKSFLGGLGIKLSKPLTEAQKQIIHGRLRSIYRVSKKAAAQAGKAKFVFGAPDVAAIAASHRQQLFWVDGFYAEHLSTRVSAVSRDVLLRQGLSHREAGKVLERALRRELGLSPGVAPSAFASMVPARYAGNPSFYFEQVASVAGHQASVFGRLRGFSDAGVVTFELINPMDERTGQVCQEMHGQVFTVDAGLKRMDAIIGARTPDEVRAAAPWLSAKVLSEALAGTKPGSAAATGRLTGLNTVLPPFHPLCRTEPVIVT